VLTDPEKLKIMLSHTNGVRQVPVIVENDQVTIGYKGET
jgi:arsenate reductase-like glutaredoxin family protein